MAAPRHNSFGRTHGLTGTPTYLTWARLVQQCTNPARFHKPQRFLTPRWHVFSNFLDDMGQQPQGHVLRLLATAKVYRPSSAFWRPTDERQCGHGRTDPADWPIWDTDRLRLRQHRVL